MHRHIVAVIALAAAACAAAGAAAPQDTAPPVPMPPVEAVTRPSADAMLSFVQPGRIQEVLVKEGDAVKPGDVLVRLDDEAELLKLAQLKADADDDLRIEAADAQTDQKKADLKKLQWAGQEGAATQWEIEHATLEVLIGELSAKLARFNKAQAVLAYEEAKTRIDKMKMRSPVAGTVENVLKEAGEAAEQQGEVIRIVCTDPLWAEVPVPLPRAVALKVGDTMEVTFPAAAQDRVKAKVVHVAAVADPASETRRVRLEVPNPGGRPAGERVRVYLP